MKILSLAITSVLVFLFGLIAIARPAGPFNTTAAASDTSADQLFSRNCAKCHGRDGKAKGLKAKAVGARSLTDSQWQDRVSDERIFNSINNGKGKMPAYGKKLSEAEINSLVTYVRSLKK
jgi:cytochrome c6